MPTSEVVIADASPFVHLDRIGRLDLLPAVYGHVVVPETIAAEVGRGGQHFPGIDLRALAWVDVLPDRADADLVADPALHGGEIAALSIARATPNHLLVIDDLAGGWQPSVSACVSLALPAPSCGRGRLVSCRPLRRSLMPWHPRASASANRYGWRCCVKSVKSGGERRGEADR